VKPGNLRQSNGFPIIGKYQHKSEDRGGTVVKVLFYKSEGRWFDPSWCQFFIDIKSFQSTMALGSTQPLTEMSTRSISWG